MCESVHEMTESLLILCGYRREEIQGRERVIALVCFFNHYKCTKQLFPFLFSLHIYFCNWSLFVVPLQDCLMRVEGILFSSISRGLFIAHMVLQNCYEIQQLLSKDNH